MSENISTSDPVAKKGMTDKQKDFLVKDYELKVRYLSDHFQRMWTRFNFFLTMESGLLGGKIIIGKGMLGREICLVLLFISVVWYLFGVQDRYLVRLYRGQVEKAGERAGHEILEDGSYTYTGKPGTGASFNSLAEWHIESLSITRLAALIPLALIVTWSITLISFLK